MAIKGLLARKDETGFPVVEWVEDRSLSAPGASFWTGGSVKVKCFITREETTGALLFATDGSGQKEALYRRRPWENLLHFKPPTAKELHYTGEDLRAVQRLKKSLAAPRKAGVDEQGQPRFKPDSFGEYLASVAGEDDATIMLAEFGDENSSIPMHLNYGIGTQVQIAELYNLLTLEFVRKRRALVDELCDGEYRWPQSKEHLAVKAEVRMPGSERFAKRVGAGITVAGMVLGGIDFVQSQPSTTLSIAAWDFLGGAIFGGIAGAICAAIFLGSVSILMSLFQDLFGK